MMDATRFGLGRWRWGRAPALALVLMAFGCGESSDPAADARPRVDAGVQIDASVLPDASLQVDASVQPDADPDAAADCLDDCSGHGTCDRSGGAPVCACDTGYAGESCATCDTGYQDNDADGICTTACDDTTCSGHGTCDDSSGTPACSCDLGYSGDACEVLSGRIAFITGAVMPNGDLGGLTGADATCQARADAAGLSGTFKAWLSSSSLGPAARFGSQLEDPYVRVDGTAIAAGWTDLTDGTLLAPLNVDETGAVVDDGFVFTNTDTDGTPYDTSQNCSDWTSSAGAGAIGQRGDSQAVDSTWTAGAGGTTCDGTFKARLYCFEQ